MHIHNDNDENSTNTVEENAKFVDEIYAQMAMWYLKYTKCNIHLRLLKNLHLHVSD